MKGTKNFITKSYKRPCPKLNVINEYIEDIVDIFWMESKNFQSNRCPFDPLDRFSIKDSFTACSHIWHEIYSLPYTQVLGFVACRVTSKRLSFGAGERSQSNMKMIKDGKRSNLSGNCLEKLAPLHIIPFGRCKDLQ